MHAWIVAGLLVAWSGAAPAPVGNQPRPQIAQPLPHGVIGVVYTFPSDTDDECEQRLELKHRDLNVYQFSRESDNGCADSISATGFEILLVKDEDGTLNSDDLTISVPPAPLPERVEDCVQVFATLPESPESCHDSDGHPPAPPAESGHCVPAVMPPHPALGTPAGLLTGYKIRLFRNENSTDAFPPPIVQKLGAEALPAEPTEPRPIPGVLTKDRLKHVQAAIQHLEAAGMTEAARRLREQSREAMTLLRQEQRRHLHEKEEELLRLSEEIEQLKTELASDAAHLHHRHAGGIGQHHRHLQQHAEGVADIVGVEFGKAFGAVAAMQQEGLALRHLAKAGHQVAGLAGEHQGGMSLELAQNTVQRRLIRVIRHLTGGFFQPTLRGPACGHATLLQKYANGPWI